MNGMVNESLKIYGNMIDGFLRDGHMVATGIDISSVGVGISCLAQFKKNSKIARMFVKNPADAPSLNRLPDRLSCWR